MSKIRWTGRMAPRVLFAVLMIGSLLTTGCKGDDGEAEGDAAEEVRYTLGEPLSDTTYAMILSSPFGGDTLSSEEFRTRFSVVMQQFPTMQGNVEQSRELRRTILEDFIMQHLLIGEANRLGLTADTAQVGQQMQQIRGQFPTQEAFQQALASENITEDSLRGSIREFIRRQMLQERMVEGATQPSEQELEEYRQEQAEEVRAQHILFLVDPTAQSQDSLIRAEAEAVLDSARSGVPFDELARRHSDDGSAQQGGDLGYFTRGQMVPPFEEAVFALSDSGDVTQELVKTRFGYHIIRLTDRRTGELMDTTRARQMMLRVRQQEAIESELERLRGLVTVRVNPDIVEVDLNERQDEL